MIIEPLKDKEGKVLTNVQVIKMAYQQLTNLKNGVGCKTQKEKEESEDRFYRICGGSDNATKLMEYMGQIVNEPDEAQAQRIFARSLQPVITK